MINDFHDSFFFLSVGSPSHNQRIRNESFIELLGNVFYYGYYQGNNAQELETDKKINIIWAIDSAKETITSRYDINFIALLQIVKLCDSDNEAMRSLFILGYNQGVKAYRNSKR